MPLLDRWTNSLKIAQKLMLIGLAFSLPIMMLLYFTIVGINGSIHFAQLEIDGEQLIEPLSELTLEIPRHRRLSEQPLSLELSDLDNRIDRSFEVLNQILMAVGDPLKINLEGLRAAGMADLSPDQLRSQWLDLRNRSAQMPPSDRQQRYEDLIQKLRRLFSRIGDTSNLILDPDLDSYYLMDVSIVGLPLAEARLNNILDLGSRLSATKKIKTEDQFALNGQAAALVGSDYVRMDVGLTTALREDKNFYGPSKSLQMRLPSVKQDYLTQLSQFSKTLDQLSRNGDKTILAELMNQGSALMNTSQVLRNTVREELITLLQQRIKSYKTQRLTYLLLSFAAIALALMMIYSISDSINHRLRQLITIAEAIAAGDLTVPVEVDSTDEIGQLLLSNRTMLDNLNRLISQMQESGLLISSVATELSVTTKEQEATVQEQAQSTTYIFQSLSQVSTLTEQLANSMNDVLQLSEATAQAAGRGQADLGHISQSMLAMDQASSSISNRLRTINEKAENITSVVTTITKVADQTNLLSLNASIEAEKAGEYGRGFSVVAREIRRLADQTAVATLDIERMVKDMQSAVTTGVMEMDGFIAKVRHSVTDVEHIGSQLETITQQVQNITTNYEGVNQTMRKQADGAHQVNDAMANLDDGMRNTTEALQYTYAAIAQLTEVAGGLRQQVSRFKVNAIQKS
jgi:methyl-accepting chemotaxis protein